MRISLAIFSLLILTLVSHVSLAMTIDFEDLTRTDPSGAPTDASGEIMDGYRGFAWSNVPSAGQSPGQPRWASLEGFFSMPGTECTYSHGTGFSISIERGSFDLIGLDVGSYFYTGQDVHAAAWENNTLKYQSTLVVSPVFTLSPFNLDFHGIDRFALWAGSQGELTAPYLTDHELCIDNISCDELTPAPVPEPSTLFILGAGIFSFTSIYRKYKVHRQKTDT